jgi:hypothetical protein
MWYFQILHFSSIKSGVNAYKNFVFYVFHKLAISEE